MSFAAQCKYIVTAMVVVLVEVVTSVVNNRAHFEGRIFRWIVCIEEYDVSGVEYGVGYERGRVECLHKLSCTPSLHNNNIAK